MINDFLVARGFTFFPHDFFQDGVGREMKFNYKWKFISVVEIQHLEMHFYYLKILSVLDTGKLSKLVLYLSRSEVFRTEAFPVSYQCEVNGINLIENKYKTACLQKQLLWP